MKFKRYSKYRDSGVEWLGEIPEHWHLIILPFNPHLIQFVDSLTYGTKMLRTSPSDIAILPVNLPPNPEQRAIAAFLDRETAKINALVAKKERLIELLQEKRRAL